MFSMSRLSAAMLRSEPDHPDRPTGRSMRGTAIGFMVAVLVAIVVVVVSALFPPKPDWRAEGALVIDKQTGARYLYLGGTLRPLMNLTTAQLLLGGKGPVVQIDSAAMSGVPRGALLGIVGAPEVLPAAGTLTVDPWLTCAVPPATATEQPSVALQIGFPALGSAVANGQATLVTGPDGVEHLLLGGRRHALDGAGVTRQALGYAAARPVPVTAEFLRLLPTGPQLAPPEVAGRGDPGTSLGGRATRVGQVFAAPGGSSYLLTATGLVPLTDTLRALVLGDPRTQTMAYGGDAPTADELGPQDVLAHLAPDQASPPAELPSTPPRLVEVAADTVLCIRTSADRTPPSHTLVTVAATSLTGRVGVAPVAGILPGCGQVSMLAVRGGSGVLLQTTAATGEKPAWYLVADNGVRYPLPADGPPAVLGYAKGSEARLPADLVNLLPTGPALDPALLQQGAGGQPMLPPTCPS